MSKIGWTDETWNPVTGCSAVSEGCTNCYAATMTRRLASMGVKQYQGLMGKHHFNGTVKCHDHKLEIPLRWQKPRRVFVNSMSDLFHEAVPIDFIDKVFGAMALASQHSFQILTKRPERIGEYLPGMGHRIYEVVTSWLDEGAEGFLRTGTAWDRVHDLAGRSVSGDVPEFFQWNVPLTNVWLGTSCEDQATAEERITHLLRCPAAVRFLSLEPLISGLDLLEWLPKGGRYDPRRSTVSGTSRTGVVRDQNAWGDLETSALQGQGDAGITLGEAEKGGREHVEKGRIPSGHVHDSRQAAESGGPSNRLDGAQPQDHPGRNGDKSSQRNQRRQQTREFGISDTPRERSPLYKGSREKAESAKRGGQRISQSDGGPSSRDTNTLRETSDATKRDRAALRDNTECGVSHCHREELAVSWVIVGCESGPKRRPCRWEWMESIVGQCQDAGVPVFVKQLASSSDGGGAVYKHKPGDEWPEWVPDTLRVQEFPK